MLGFATVPKVRVAIQTNGEGDRDRGHLFLLPGSGRPASPSSPLPSQQTPGGPDPQGAGLSKGAGSEQSEESFVSWRPPEHTVLPGGSREREEGGGRG